MRLGAISPGRMGTCTARRLACAGFDVIDWNRIVARAEELARVTPRLNAAGTLEDLTGALASPRRV